MNPQDLIDRLRRFHTLTDSEFKEILVLEDEQAMQYLYKNAGEVCRQHYGTKVYARGLIEFTNYCRNNCYYCGIRRGNEKADRYRLSELEILSCVEEGYRLGFRTFVLQGGEDCFYTKERLGGIVKRIKEAHPNCAVTLSFGEWDYDTYQYWHACGADRYLLRQETADEEHYAQLHPQEMRLERRMECLRNLKAIGYQTGAGFMAGTPGQTLDSLLKDLRFLEEFQPQMAGIGPFIPQKDTPFAKKAGGTLCMTLKLLAVVRLMLPKILLPSTTALGTIHPDGREFGICAGANVVMPNLSPESVRKKYQLYDDKICSGSESAQGSAGLSAGIRRIGYELCMERGDSLMRGSAC